VVRKNYNEQNPQVAFGVKVLSMTLSCQGNRIVTCCQEAHTIGIVVLLLLELFLCFLELFFAIICYVYPLLIKRFKKKLASIWVFDHKDMGSCLG